MATGVRLGGLWWKPGKDGSQYLEGQLGTATIRIFINDQKKSDKAPDASMVLSEKAKPDASRPVSRGFGSPQARPTTPGSHPYAPKPVNHAPQAKPVSRPIPKAQENWGNENPTVGPEENVPWPEEDEFPF